MPERVQPGVEVVTPEETQEVAHRRVRGRTNARLAGLSVGVRGGAELSERHTRETVRQWIETIRPGLAPINKEATALLTAFQQNQKASEADRKVLSGIASDCMGHLRTLQQICTGRAIDGGTGDPIALARYISMLRTRGIIQGLEQHAEAGHPLVREFLAIIGRAETAFPYIHGAVRTGDHYAMNRNEAVAKREGQAIRMVGALAGGIGFAITTFIALRSDDPGMTAPAMYLGVAAISAGWGNLTMTGQERLASQVGWLTQPPGRRTMGLQDLRGRGYTISGNGWADFAQMLYTEQGRKLVGNTIHYRRNFRERNEKRAKEQAQKNGKEFVQNSEAIIKAAPESIRGEVRRMLGSTEGATEAARKENPDGIDFRAFFSLLLRARTAETQGIVVNYIRSGASARSLQHERARSSI